MAKRVARRTRKRGFIVGAVVVVVILAGIAGWLIVRSGSGPTAATPPTSTLNTPASRLSGLRPAPDFRIAMYQGAETVGGSQISLARLWGTGKPVVLNFWAGLCPPCRAEMPDFQALYAEFAKGKWTLIGVDIGPFVGLGSREDAQALLRELKITYPAGTTFDEGTLSTYQILGMPTTVFITPDGKILRKTAGMLTREQMTLFVTELLQASGVR